MSSSKKQSIIITGIAMLIIAVIMLSFALSQPKMTLSEYSSSKAESSSVASTADITEVQTDSSENQQSAKTEHSTAPVSFPINLNNCTVDELMAVEGIGETKASDIIEYRSYLGGYTSVEQIKNISGIGDGVYEKISPYLCV